MILPFHSLGDVQAALPRVRSHLAEGKLLAYPTETVYGLGSLATADALDALARLKGRPTGKPFLLLVADRAMAETWGLLFTRSAHALASAFWPGPLTLVLKGGEGRLPDALRGREGGIAVRLTGHAGMRRLIEGLGLPVTSTSANVPGGRPAPGAEGVPELFPDAVAQGELLVLDGGVLGDVPPSTLVDCTERFPKLIREGALPREELRRAVGYLAP